MVQHLKSAIRKDILAKRDALTESDIQKLSSAICDKLIANERFIEAKRIAFYIRKGSEVDTEKMIGHAIRQGKEVFVPVTDHKIFFVKFTSFTDLKPGKYGILEPSTREKQNNIPENQGHEPELIIIPGVVFGLCMHRLGYGKGYYDDYLGKSFAQRIGICYDFQVVEKLPTHENDQRMDQIITEKRIISLM